MVHVVVLPADTVKSNTGKGSKNKKNLEAVDMAITEAISRHFGCMHTPRTCMLTAVATMLQKKKKHTESGQ